MSKTQAGPVSAGRLKSFFERIEKLVEERKAIQGDIKDVFSEAKGVGYNVAIMRKVLVLRTMDAADRDEQETLIDVYMHALQTIDRVEDRVAGGESIRKAADAEGMPKSTAIRHVTQNSDKSENGSGKNGAGGETPACRAPADDEDTTTKAKPAIVDDIPPATSHTERAAPNAGLSAATDDVLTIPDFLDRRAKAPA